MHDSDMQNSDRHSSDRHNPAMHKKDQEQFLNKAFKALPRAVQPERDLWPGIAHALERPVPVDWMRFSALAASVLLVVTLSLYFAMQQPLASQRGTALADLVSGMQQEHQSNVQALLAKYQDQQPYYPDWQVQMTQLQQAEDAIYDALREDPENLELLKILRQVQNRQIQLIDAVYAPRFNTI